VQDSRGDYAGGDLRLRAGRYSGCGWRDAFVAKAQFYGLSQRLHNGHSGSSLRHIRNLRTPCVTEKRMLVNDCD
jgi:hypothetical protein